MKKRNTALSGKPRPDLRADQRGSGFNSDWQGYSKDFEGHWSGDLVPEPGEYDGFPFHAELSIASYSALIFSQ